MGLSPSTRIRSRFCGPAEIASPMSQTLQRIGGRRGQSPLPAVRENRPAPRFDLVGARKRFSGKTEQLTLIPGLAGGVSEEMIEVADLDLTVFIAQREAPSVGKEPRLGRARSTG